MIEQDLDIACPLAQRRQVNAVHVQAIEEICSEGAAIDSGLEIRVRGGDEADVHVAWFVFADAADLARLQRTQQFRLEGGRHRPDFVQEQCSRVCVLDEPHPAAGRTRECPPDVTKELVLEQRVRERGAVQRNE